MDITNMIPIHAFVLLLMGRYSGRLYVAYSSWYAISTLASMQAPFVGFQPVRTSEHMAALGILGLLQIFAFAQLVRSHVSSQQFQSIVIAGVVTIGILGALAIVGLTYKGWIASWTGRFYSLWDTGYAKKYIPIIASVSGHQPTAWPSFFMDLQFLIFVFQAGVILCFRELRDEHIFVIIYAAVASYFADVMVRLMLTLTSVVCASSAVALSTLLDTFIDPTEPEVVDDSQSEAGSGIYGLDTRTMIVFNIIAMLAFFVSHCTWATSTAYSSPSVVLASQNPDGTPHIIDGFREAYYWLRQNTPEDAVVMSWWDYGYQIAGMADRPTLVDNNTWNNTHIATVGKAMSSSEEVAYPILRKHDVSYVLVIFRGLIGYSGDDINKFL
ncbi:Dolichyl-diphosphooligosaccharide--protein glycosyltransferase subunit stt3 [Termitomyces sp. J132]|nr:Dolichyl-diphosphooligosaccharide--protein glycosyltransferase subunit stt3 [Termitomyces sp. J132]